MSYTGRLSCTSSNMFRAPLVMGSTMHHVVHWISWASLILIGLVISQIVSPCLGTCLVWVLVPSVGRAKSSQILLYRQQRLSIEERSMSLFMNFVFKTYSLSLASSFIIQLSFGVTIRVLSIFVETQCNDNGPNTSRSICTTS